MRLDLEMWSATAAQEQDVKEETENNIREKEATKKKAKRKKRENGRTDRRFIRTGGGSRGRNM